MAGEDPHQFLAGIAGGAHQGDIDSLVRPSVDCDFVPTSGPFAVTASRSYLCRANYLYTSTIS